MHMAIDHSFVVVPMADPTVLIIAPLVTGEGSHLTCTTRLARPEFYHLREK